MLFVGSTVGEVAPAAFAFGVGADFHGGGEGTASGEVDVGFEVGADLFGLTGGFDGLLDDGAGFEEVFDCGEGGVFGGHAKA